ncbi:MAG: hypothetical protein LBH00_05290 [Planctomycetaceae bacterium]|jgi:hypothetical protein|nr:hypothetical protein [Planctomycetaceae bacterium]
MTNIPPVSFSAPVTAAVIPIINMRAILFFALLIGMVALSGCQSLLLTAMVIFKGTDVPPQFDVLLKGDKRVAVVARSMAANAYELQNAPREIARHVNNLLEEKVRNKKLRVVDQTKVEQWLDNCDNDFESFTEIGKSPSIKADIVIGIDVIGFQIRDPRNAYLVQGKCHVAVQAVECSTGKIVASKSLTIVDPPSTPLPGGIGLEEAFRPKFIQVVAQQIAMLFHHHDPHSKRIDADSLEMHRID